MATVTVEASSCVETCNLQMAAKLAKNSSTFEKLGQL
jgi:hypothetical protein